MSTAVAEHIDLLVSAEKGIAALRRLVFDLAIRGRLVAQDEMPQNSESTVEEQPFALPAGWSWTTLGAVATLSPRNQVADTSMASFVPMAAISSRFGQAHEQETRAWSEVKSGFTHFAEGDVCVAKITPCFENSKACVFSGLVNGVGAGTTELHVVRPHPATVIPRYVLAYFKSSWFLHNGESKMTGTAGQKRLPKEFVRSHPFPLPPLAEQHRIVAKVDELMALCDRLEARQQDAEAAHTRLVQVLLDSLTQARDAEEFQAHWERVAGQFEVLFTTDAAIDALQSAILQLAIGGRLATHDASDEPAAELLKKIEVDAVRFCKESRAPRANVDPIELSSTPFELPANWKWVRLGAVFRVITDGDHQAPPQTDHGVAFLTIGNVTKGHLNFEACRSVDARYFEQLAEYRKPSSGDLLYTVVGATYGRPVLVDTDRAFCVQRHIAILKRSEHLDSSFALCLLKSPLVYGQASACTTGTAQPTIPLKPLRNIVVPLPPLKEQQRIATKVEELLSLCGRLRKRAAEARARQVLIAEALVAEARTA